MPFVIAEPCIGVLDKACQDVCPVDCIHCDDGKDWKLYINPNECIECAACEPACPVEAIYSEYELPAAWEYYAAIDALWYRDKEAAREQVNTAKKES